MTHIKGYWIINGSRSNFIEDGFEAESQDQIDNYRREREAQHGHEVILRQRELPQKLKDIILADFMENTPTLQDLADKYDVARKTVNNILTDYLKIT